MIKWPIVREPGEAKCFKCGGDLGEPRKSGDAPAHGEFRAFCSSCEMWTWFDYEKRIETLSETFARSHGRKAAEAMKSGDVDEAVHNAKIAASYGLIVFYGPWQGRTAAERRGDFGDES